ncbi:hypothetical protein ACFC4G_45360 [Streptomyces sp. NPDC056002]|uniref:hypothetical protein n=1 Tax=Streptomyces sp. NPDC056002 TaxID=3345675 RepID=UPI0035D98936
MAEADVAAVLAGLHTAVASDGWELDTSGEAHPHPRHVGTFARVFGAAARGEGPLTLLQKPGLCRRASRTSVAQR